MLSVCSGIGTDAVAWHPLGWKHLCFAEIEKFPSAVLKHRWPDIPNEGDFTKIGDKYRGAADLLVGGTPCQSFSVAGLRGGLADDRGNLALEFLRLADRTRPRWVVWENVPGVYSSLSHEAPDPCPPPPPMDMGCDGAEVETEDEYSAEELHALNCFLAGLSELGYGWAYRILDAQYFGVPQRRRRVFVVGHLGDWRAAAAVLFERHSLQGNHPPRRKEGQDVAGTIGGSSQSGGFRTTDLDNSGAFIAIRTAQTGSNGWGIGIDEQAYTLDGAQGQAVACIIPILEAGARTGASTDDLRCGIGVGEDGDPMFTLQSGKQHAVAVEEPFTLAIRGRGEGHNLEYRQDGTANAVLTPNGGRAGIGVGAVAAPSGQSMAVRRLTPRECERLQGLPDDYTLIPYNGKPAADGPRYKAIGNGMAVPVVRWIGERIARVNIIEPRR